MKKIIFSASVFILSAVAVNAQHTQSVVSAAGGVNKTANGIELEWTLGEPVIGISTTTNRLYTAGFNQPFINIKDVKPEINFPAQLIQAYPNPVNSRLLVQLPSGQSEQVKLVLS